MDKPRPRPGPLPLPAAGPAGGAAPGPMDGTGREGTGPSALARGPRLPDSRRAPELTVGVGVGVEALAAAAVVAQQRHAARRRDETRRDATRPTRSLSGTAAPPLRPAPPRPRVFAKVPAAQAHCAAADA